MLSQEKLDDTSICPACGTILEIDLDSDKLVLPDRRSHHYALLEKGVQQAKTVGRSTCVTLIGLLDRLNLVDSSMAHDFLHSVYMEWNGFGYLQPEKFNGLTEFPSDFHNWNEIRPLRMESVEAVLLFAVWVTLFNKGSFTELATNALIIANPISHLRAKHSWTQARDSYGTNRFYILRTGEKQYLCADKQCYG